MSLPQRRKQPTNSSDINFKYPPISSDTQKVVTDVFGHGLLKTIDSETDKRYYSKVKGQI